MTAAGRVAVVLRPCRLCGGAAQLQEVGPECSTHSGWHTIRCERGDQELTVRAMDMPYQAIMGGDGWDALGVQWRAARDTAIDRWQRLNQP